MFVACERNNATVTDSLQVDANLKADFIPSESNIQSLSEEFEYEVVVLEDGIDFSGGNSNELVFEFTTSSENVFDLSYPVGVVPVYEQRETGDMQFDIITEVSQIMPTNISYNGSSLSYTVHGQNFSGFLNTEEKEILDQTQAALSEAKDALFDFDGCTTFPCENSANKSGQNLEMGETEQKSFQTMTNEEVIEFFEALNYEVEHISGKRFSITRRYTEDDGILAGFTATHVFDAATADIEPMGTVNKKGRTLARLNRLDGKNRNSVLQSIIERNADSGMAKGLLINSKRKN